MFGGHYQLLAQVRLVRFGLCAGRRGSAEWRGSQNAAPQKHPFSVKIAVAGPLTAGATLYGTGMQRATQLAVQDYASALTSAGVSVTVVSFDDEGDPDVATSNAATIIADTAILGVVGHVNSGCTIVASKVYAEGNLAVISPISTDPVLTQRGLNNVFRTCGTDPMQGSYAADVVSRNLRLTRAYVVNDSTSYGKALASAFSKQFVARGGKVVGKANTSFSSRNFSALVKKIKAAKPTVVYYGGLYMAGGPLAKQLKAKGVNATFVGPDGLLVPEFVSLAGKSAAAGTISTTLGLPFDQLPGGIAFNDRYSALYPGSEPGAHEALSYDAATAVIKAIVAVAAASGPGGLAGAGARESVRGKIAASDFTGVTGTVAFDAAGDTKHPTISVWRVKSGAWKTCAQVGKPGVPATSLMNESIAVVGSLMPRHAPGSKVVVLKFSRKVGSKWVLGKTVTAAVADSGGFSEYSATVKLSAKGSWRVIATHSDSAHASMDSVVSTFKVE